MSELWAGGLAVCRQDHPLVRAIRLAEEDWREVELAARAPAVLPESVGESGVWGRRRGGAEAEEQLEGELEREEVCISQLHRRATLLDGEFQESVRRALLRQFQAQVDFHSAPVKTKARMREKVKGYWQEAAANKHHRDHDQDEHHDRAKHHQLPLAGNIMDPIRSTVVCDGPAEMLEVVEWLVGAGAADCGLTVVRVKNKFAAADASEHDGYRDLMVSVRYAGSLNLNIIGEIQVHDRRLHALKLQMHKLYKVKRATHVTKI